MNNSEKALALLSENEIDTALFAIFGLFARQLGQNWHVCLCNPPGGDWSRITVVSSVDKSLHTWNTLPRVRDENKLPDFVAQVFSHTCEKSYILSIESKDSPRNLESNIGKRMNDFMHWLVREVEASTVRLPCNQTTELGKQKGAGEHILIGAVATTFSPERKYSILTDIWSRCHCNLCFNLVKIRDQVEITLYIKDQGIYPEFEQILITTLQSISHYSGFRFAVGST